MKVEGGYLLADRRKRAEAAYFPALRKRESEIQREREKERERVRERELFTFLEILLSRVEFWVLRLCEERH